MAESLNECRKNDFVTTTPLMPSLLTITCKCGKKFEVSLDDAHLEQTIKAHPCCNAEPPLHQLKKAIEKFSKYVEARAKLASTGWDANLTAPP
jgi:hypothetical protein